MQAAQDQDFITQILQELVDKVFAKSRKRQNAIVEELQAKKRKVIEPSDAVYYR